MRASSLSHARLGIKREYNITFLIQNNFFLGILFTLQMKWKLHLNRHFPNLLESAQNNSLKLRRAILTATKQWFTLPVLISCYSFVCTQANSGSVYYEDNLSTP